MVPLQKGNRVDKFIFDQTQVSVNQPIERPDMFRKIRLTNKATRFKFIWQRPIHADLELEVAEDLKNCDFGFAYLG